MPIMRRLQILTTLLAVSSRATARVCDDFSFCTDPGMTIIEGNYEFGQTYGDQSCLATTENAQSFSMMVAESSGHINGTVTVNLMAKNNDYSAAVGGRLSSTPINLETSVCRGYTGYWCYLNRQTTKGNSEITAELEIKKCGETSMSSLDVSTTSTDTVTLDTAKLYKLEFILDGNLLTCGLKSYSSSYESDDYLADVEVNDNDYREGIMGIANWGTSWYYRNSTYCAMPGGPTKLPSPAPTYLPSPAPSEEPSYYPTGLPTNSPSPYPSEIPSALPSIVPTPSPTEAPTSTPTDAPTSLPTPLPISAPSPNPTAAPSLVPSPSPTEAPSPLPSPIPTIGPTPYPSAVPSPNPTPVPTIGPTPYPSSTPTPVPTHIPTHDPTPTPTQEPTQSPTSSPTMTPTPLPTDVPTHSPTEAPTIPPSKNPSQAPTPTPSQTPTQEPTSLPSNPPSPSPTHYPSQLPSGAPTPLPTGFPSMTPSPAPTQDPTPVPTTPEPSSLPTAEPTHFPTAEPTHLPTPHPTRAPTLHPSGKPSAIPSPAPSETPTSYPSEAPSFVPSPSPTHTPTSLPTVRPSMPPTPSPSHPPSPQPTPKPSEVPTPFPSTWVPTSVPTAVPTSDPTTAPTLVPTVGPTPYPSPVPTDEPTLHPTPSPSMSPTTYCYDPKPTDIAPVYSYIDTIGGDMVSWIYANYLEIESKVDELWLPYLGTNKGNQPGGKTHYTADDDQGQDPSLQLDAVTISSYGRSMKSSKEGAELRRLVSGFTQGAHLVKDVEPLNQRESTLRKTSLSQQAEHTFIQASGGVPVTSAVLMAVAALALGIAFQNQKAWTEMSSSRFSRAEYSALI